MNNIPEFYKRVASWNSKRYEQVYNHELACSLLFEELCEFFESVETVDKLDALCDIAYVAMGIIWKLGDNPSEYFTEASKLASSLLNVDKIQPVFHVSAVYQSLQHDDELPIATSAATIILLCTSQLANYGLTNEEIFKCLEAVCDANDSKSIVKVAPNVKANGGGNKGPLFVSPEPRLKAILDKVYARHN